MSRQSSEDESTPSYPAFAIKTGMSDDQRYQVYFPNFKNADPHYAPTIEVAKEEASNLIREISVNYKKNNEMPPLPINPLTYSYIGSFLGCYTFTGDNSSDEQDTRPPPQADDSEEKRAEQQRNRLARIPAIQYGVDIYSQRRPAADAPADTASMRLRGIYPFRTRP